MRSRQSLNNLSLWVLVAIALGIVLGVVAPDRAAAMKPLGDGFIKLVKMLIAPIVFTTVVVGIAQVGAMKDVGRIGLRALLYFEVVSTLALALGLLAVTLYQPGIGVNFSPKAADLNAVSNYATASKHLGVVDFLLNIIPDTIVGAFAAGEILQVLLISILFGIALLALGPLVRPLVDVISQVSKGLFEVIRLVMWVAPIGAFGAMAFSVGRYGLTTLVALGKLVALMYATSLLFILIVLGSIAAAAGFNILKFLRYIGEEIAIVFGTSSSEAALPRLMTKLEGLGCSKAVVGLVVPAGYAFNLDGSSIYMTLAAIFVAQATGVHLTFAQQLGILGLLTITSKGSAAVTGGGFITLAATLSAFPSIPLAGLALLVGVDRFMSTARALTNLIGNAVATMVIARWDGALDLDRVTRVLNGESEVLQVVVLSEDV